jgi:hypothetical protein
MSKVLVGGNKNEAGAARWEDLHFLVYSNSLKVKLKEQKKYIVEEDKVTKREKSFEI